MSEYRPTYNRFRFPVQPGKGLCRGCGKPVPLGRFSWCSDACVKRFEPRSVIFAVRQRDKGICQMCGKDTRAEHRAWEKACPVDSCGYLLRDKSYFQWTRDEPKPAEYDHIIPMCEGGLTVLENMRTLCNPCHKHRTKEWHKTRVKKPVSECC